MTEDIIRVLRIIEYVGPRSKVEEQVNGSLHGEREGIRGVTIRAATIGNFPEILEGGPRHWKGWDEAELSVRSTAIMKRHYPLLTPAKVLAEWELYPNGKPQGVTKRVENEIRELAKAYDK